MSKTSKKTQKTRKAAKSGKASRTTTEVMNDHTRSQSKLDSLVASGKVILGETAEAPSPDAKTKAKEEKNAARAAKKAEKDQVRAARKAEREARKAETKDLMVFAFRLSKVESEQLHQAAGPGKASSFARNLLVKASAAIRQGATVESVLDAIASR